MCIRDLHSPHKNGTHIGPEMLSFQQKHDIGSKPGFGSTSNVWEPNFLNNFKNLGLGGVRTMDLEPKSGVWTSNSMIFELFQKHYLPHLGSSPKSKVRAPTWNFEMTRFRSIHILNGTGFMEGCRSLAQGLL